MIESPPNKSRHILWLKVLTAYFPLVLLAFFGSGCAVGVDLAIGAVKDFEMPTTTKMDLNMPGPPEGQVILNNSKGSFGQYPVPEGALLRPITKDMIMKSWGPPKRRRDISGGSQLVYNSDFRGLAWRGLFLVLPPFIPLPLEVPLGHNEITLSFKDDILVSASEEYNRSLGYLAALPSNSDPFALHDNLEQGNITYDSMNNASGPDSVQVELPYEKSGKKRMGPLGHWVNDGPYVGYYGDSGAVKETGVYSAGQKAGEWRLFHRNGRLMGEGTYVDGVRSADWHYWDADGNDCDALLIDTVSAAEGYLSTEAGGRDGMNSEYYGPLASARPASLQVTLSNQIDNSVADLHQDIKSNGNFWEYTVAPPNGHYSLYCILRRGGTENVNIGFYSRSGNEITHYERSIQATSETPEVFEIEASSQGITVTPN